jgi:hypothetical protein
MVLELSSRIINVHALLLVSSPTIRETRRAESKPRNSLQEHAVTQPRNKSSACWKRNSFGFWILIYNKYRRITSNCSTLVSMQSTMKINGKIKSFILRQWLPAWKVDARCVCSESKCKRPGDRWSALFQRKKGMAFSMVNVPMSK